MIFPAFLFALAIVVAILSLVWPARNYVLLAVAAIATNAGLLLQIGQVHP